MPVPDKVALRARARAVRSVLAAGAPDAADRVVLFLDALPAGSLVALYCAMGLEFDPAPMARALTAAGRALCLPVVLQRDAPMIFRRWSPGDPLEPDGAGCPAPLPLAEVVDPDLIVTPLLAFDDYGGRLGQGGGYYDRTFAARPDVVRIGLAYAGQRVPRLALESHDIRLHGMLTEVGYRPYPFDISRPSP